MKSSCAVYLFFRCVVGFLDVTSDILLSLHLILEDHLFWGLAVLGWVLFAFLMSFSAVIVERCRRDVPMSTCKYILMTFKIHAELGEAFFESGPMVIMQLMMFWSGMHLHPLETYTNSSSLSMAWAWLEVFSLAMSFISLNFTAIRYNNETGPCTKAFWSSIVCFFTSLYRVFVISVILILDLGISSLILLFIFIVNIVLYRIWGHQSSCLPHAFYGLFMPIGHTQATNVKAGYISATSGVPESERTKINQESLLRRIEKVFITHYMFSILLLVPYFCMLELWFNVQTIDFLHNRLFTHITPIALLLISVVPSLCYYLQARKARNAARTWMGIGSALIEPKREHTVRDIASEDEADESSIVRHSANLKTSEQPQNEKSVHNFEPPAMSTLMASPSVSRPCSMLYPYLPSAPAPSECGDLDTIPRHTFPGGRKCDDEDCVTCAWMKEGPNFCSSVTRRQYKFMTPSTCTDEGLVYVVTCSRCRKQYVGRAEESLRQSNTEHRRDIETQGTLLGRHFGSVCGYENWSIQIIDKCPLRELARREKYWQEELTTLFPVGLNESKENKKL